MAESKFLSDPESYRRLCEEGDVAGVLALLTNVAVEKKVRSQREAARSEATRGGGAYMGF